MELPRDLVTPKNIPDLELMTHLYESMTNFPSEELVVLNEKHLLCFGTEEKDEKEAKIHVCLLFPFVGNTAQAYDCVLGIALHVKRVRGDLIASVYVSSQDFRVVAPFVMPTALALTRKDSRSVLINKKGEIVRDPVPNSWLRGLLH